LENITQYNENIHHGDIGMYLYKIPNVYRYCNRWVEHPLDWWVENSFIWLHSICNIYTMEETTSYLYGTNIEYKRDYSLYRVALLQIYIKRYINSIRHRMWHPDSDYVTKLKENFDTYKNKLL